LERCFFLAAILLAACGDSATQLKNGEPAPPFRLESLGDDRLAFPGDLKGQIVALRFWADWCPFCESEMKDIEPVYSAYRDKGLRVLAVNVRQDRETAEAFIRRLGISYEVLLDPEGEVARAYGVIGLPTTFFLDREGRLSTRILGESTPEVFERIVQDLL
jgi:peroxiredoxin